MQEGHCQKGQECVYRHQAPVSDRRQEDCPFYDYGFCKQGSYYCPMSHVQKEICTNYMLGFCPDGPNCLKEHVKSLIPDKYQSLTELANFPLDLNWVDKSQKLQEQFDLKKSLQAQSRGPNANQQQRVRCHNCGEVGHKSTYCQEEAIDTDELNKLLSMDQDYIKQNQSVMCFYCQLYGHYANVCPERAKAQKLKLQQEAQHHTKAPVIKQVANLINTVQEQPKRAASPPSQQSSHHSSTRPFKKDKEPRSFTNRQLQPRENSIRSNRSQNIANPKNQSRERSQKPERSSNVRALQDTMQKIITQDFSSNPLKESPALFDQISTPMTQLTEHNSNQSGFNQQSSVGSANQPYMMMGFGNYGMQQVQLMHQQMQEQILQQQQQQAMQMQQIQNPNKMVQVSNCSLSNLNLEYQQIRNAVNLCNLSWKSKPLQEVQKELKTSPKKPNDIRFKRQQ